MSMKYWDALAALDAISATARQGRDAAFGANDAAANAAANAAITGTAELWGKPIPITWGRRRITGQLLQIGPQSQQTVTTRYRLNPTIDSDIISFGGGLGWMSNIGEKTETRFVSTFAYCFGQPGNKNAKQILTKLWFNGQLVYDVNAGQLSNEIRFKFYAGNEEQLPDGQLSGTRYAYPVAYRGMMYIVFYEYSIAGQTSEGNPTVEAEFAEELSNNNPVSRYDTYGTTIATSFNGHAIDPKKGVVYAAASNGRFYKFDIARKTLLSDYPSSNYPTGGPGNNPTLLAIHAFARLNNVPYVFCTAAAGNVRDLLMFNADTGVCVASYRPALGSFAISMANARVSTFEGVGCIYLATSGIVSNVQLFRCTESSISLVHEYLEPDPELAIALPDGRLVHVVGAGVWLAGSLFYTMPQNISQIFYVSFDNTLVVISNSSIAPWSIRKITLDAVPVVKWELTSDTYGNFTFPIGNQRDGFVSLSNTGGDQRVAWSNTLVTAVLDMISGSFELVPRVNSSFGSGIVFDAFTNTLIGWSSVAGGASLVSYPIYNQTSGNMLLSTFLRDVALLQGYEDANIVVEGIPDTIIGALITQQTDIESMLNDIRRCYNFQIIKSGKHIRFTRRGYGTSMVVDGSYTEDQRAVLSEDDGVVTTVETEIVSATQAAGTIVLSYIDPDYNYTVVPFTYKRNDPSYDQSISLPLNLPIIMHGSEAAALAARALIDNNMSDATQSFRLPQAYIAHEPGDLIELIYDDYSETVRAVEISYNADFSLSIKSEGTYTQDGPTYILPPPVLPPEPPALLSGEAMPLILDTTLMRAADEYDRETLETYVSAVSSGRLPLTAGVSMNKAVADATMATVASIMDVLTVGQLTATMSAGPVMQVNYDEVINFRIVQGDGASFHTDTLENMLAGANRLLVGMSGRWEQIGYITAAVDSATNVVTLTGIVRGWRGTELFAGLHATGDYILPIDDPAIALVTDLPSDLAKIATYAASDNMLRLNYEDAQGVAISGITRRPWAPYNVHVVASGGDLALSWKRRTRLTGPLEDGTGVVPLDEASEAYRLVIYRAGAAVRTVELTAPTYTYTATAQAADGWAGSVVSIQLDVMQLSELVGPGFIKSGTYDVE